MKGGRRESNILDGKKERCREKKSTQGEEEEEKWGKEGIKMKAAKVLSLLTSKKTKLEQQKAVCVVLPTPRSSRAWLSPLPDALGGLRSEMPKGADMMRPTSPVLRSDWPGAHQAHFFFQGPQKTTFPNHPCVWTGTTGLSLAYGVWMEITRTTSWSGV